MNRLIAAFARDTVFANIVLVILLPAGTLAAFSMVRETFPFDAHHSKTRTCLTRYLSVYDPIPPSIRLDGTKTLLTRRREVCYIRLEDGDPGKQAF